MQNKRQTELKFSHFNSSDFIRSSSALIENILRIGRLSQHTNHRGQCASLDGQFAKALASFLLFELFLSRTLYDNRHPSLFSCLLFCYGFPGVYTTYMPFRSGANCQDNRIAASTVQVLLLIV